MSKKTPEIQYIGKHMTALEALDIVEDLVRGASIPGLLSKVPRAKREGAMAALFSRARESAKDGFFASVYVEYEISFGVSATLNVNFDYVNYEVEKGRFASGDVKAFVRAAPRVTVNAPSMNKTVEQAVAFANLLTDVAKLAAAINVALNDAVLVKFEEEK